MSVLTLSNNQDTFQKRPLQIRWEFGQYSFYLKAESRMTAHPSFNLFLPKLNCGVRSNGSS